MQLIFARQPPSEAEVYSARRLALEEWAAPRFPFRRAAGLPSSDSLGLRSE
jgi:hypothetical protein